METIDYDRLIQEALRDVVRKALKEVSDNKDRLPGNHHFYITFRTDRTDVVVPDYLRKQHPEEVTIVLQYQFWDLKVTEGYFEVTLSFSGTRERLKIPFSALVSFMDPWVKFGLQFLPDEGPETRDPVPSSSAEVPGKPSSKSSKSKQGSDKVVTLEHFRKNKK